MRRLLLVCALSIVSSAAVDALPSKPSVGLYADAAHQVTSLSPPAYSSFQIWIWWLPSEHGLMASEFEIVIPPNVVVLTSVQNPALCVCLGRCLGPYLCPLFNECQADWVWTHQMTCLLTDPAPGYVEIVPRSGESVIWAATCEAGYPPEAVVVYDKFGVNQDAVIAVEPQSWGAIKSIYR